MYSAKILNFLTSPFQLDVAMRLILAQDGYQKYGGASRKIAYKELTQSRSLFFLTFPPILYPDT